ncbi:phosphonate C-P lyase system protein PhnH [Macrococcoides caseolyticum]|uniref:phosphonate C-P lyase system protein PhnH n=1 Tax=Macrococcoides caseolyticum TaxID=69966 RepID=UPI001F1F2E06|nr:phosphonate C-P lyase system protein PhnH [Macrococcus caseolyticus]MCE4956016.1 phosphonate C-P lyase system protein PhnH [Macrococcus caseolyticus]
MYVHEMTHMFRQVMDGMSKPGVINPIEGITHRTSYSDAMYLLLQTLLDNEVTFHIVNGLQSDREEIQLLLNSRVVDLQLADYIIMKQQDLSDVHRLLESKRGTYKDPEVSATWLIQLDHFSSGDVYTLTGPGIKTQVQVNLPGMSELIAQRNQLCQSFPLGVDMIFVTDDSVLCIPRTTVIKEVH